MFGDLRPFFCRNSGWRSCARRASIVFAGSPSIRASCSGFCSGRLPGSAGAMPARAAAGHADRWRQRSAPAGTEGAQSSATCPPPPRRPVRQAAVPAAATRLSPSGDFAHAHARCDSPPPVGLQHCQRHLRADQHAGEHEIQRLAGAAPSLPSGEVARNARAAVGGEQRTRSGLRRTATAARSGRAPQAWTPQGAWDPACAGAMSAHPGERATHARDRPTRERRQQPGQRPHPFQTLRVRSATRHLAFASRDGRSQDSRTS